jgi:tellurite resistance protein
MAPSSGASALSPLVAILAEDAMFALAAGSHDPADALEGVGKRRAEAYGLAIQGMPVPRMSGQYDAWLIQMTRAMAPISPPAWVPMMEVVREKVTLEIGARGIRSLFSSKPSEKDVLRVKKLGTLAVRTLRAVFAADGPVDKEEATTLAAVIAALGLPEADATALYNELNMGPDKLDVYGEIEPNIARALVRGAWLAAAWDSIDPREDAAIRTIATKLGVTSEDVETSRADAQQRVDARRTAGLAAVDGVRFVLSDRVPGPGVSVAALAGTLMLPRRFRDEALAPIGHGTPVTLAKRYSSLAPLDRVAVLGIAWAAALTEDPTVGRRALLRARWERFAADLGEETLRALDLVDGWLGEVLAGLTRNLR